jgi:endonuclease VIII
MRGRWHVQARDSRPRKGRPWLVLQSATHEAVLWNGPVLELTYGAWNRPRVGPDILGEPPDLDRMMENLRREPPARELGEALLDQRLVAGIGNVWKAESLWRVGVSPWRKLGEIRDEDLRATLVEAARLMRGSLESGREQRAVYRRAGRPCPRCGTAIRSRGQGDDNRTAYWCPECQRGAPAAEA